MNKLLSCEFNIDTGNVELHYTDGNMIIIDCTEVEKEVAMSINARSELDWLVYNAPLDYAEMVLCGNLEGYLRQVLARTAELKAIPKFIVSELSIKSTDTQLCFCFSYG